MRLCVRQSIFHCWSLLHPCIYKVDVPWQLLLLLIVILAIILTVSLIAILILTLRPCYVTLRKIVRLWLPLKVRDRRQSEMAGLYDL